MKRSTRFTALLCTAAMAAVPGFDDHEINFWMERYGYTAEPFQATSETGYVSTIFQVKGPYQGESKGSVFFMHGTWGDAENWFKSAPSFVLSTIGVVQGPDYRPALFEIVDAGYDLWVGALRGSKDNLGHTSMNWQDSSNT